MAKGLGDTMIDPRRPNAIPAVLIWVRGASLLFALSSLFFLGWGPQKLVTYQHLAPFTLFVGAAFSQVYTALKHLLARIQQLEMELASLRQSGTR